MRRRKFLHNTEHVMKQFDQENSPSQNTTSDVKNRKHKFSSPLTSRVENSLLAKTAAGVSQTQNTSEKESPVVQPKAARAKSIEDAKQSHIAPSERVTDQYVCSPEKKCRSILKTSGHQVDPPNAPKSTTSSVFQVQRLRVPIGLQDLQCTPDIEATCIKQTLAAQAQPVQQLPKRGELHPLQAASIIHAFRTHFAPGLMSLLEISKTSPAIVSLLDLNNFHLHQNEAICLSEPSAILEIEGISANDCQGDPRDSAMEKLLSTGISESLEDSKAFQLSPSAAQLCEHSQDDPFEAQMKEFSMLFSCRKALMAEAARSFKDITLDNSHLSTDLQT